VFVNVADPVGEGFVEGLPRPGANITGFIHVEASMAGKSLELLIEIAPGIKRAAIIFNVGASSAGHSMNQKSLSAQRGAERECDMICHASE
jgi:putative tryptophan/tyrosine transport system substrate-binding protein